MYTRRRELLADWLIVAGGFTLFISLFMTWTHQFGGAFLAQFGSSSQLQGVPHDPTAWQVYSAADVLLALLALALVVVALVGGRRSRMGAVVACAIALAFTLHALSKPPTNGANIFDQSLSVPAYFPTGATAGPGITVAIVALGVALIGLALSFTAD
jgi:hypothetical protein